MTFVQENVILNVRYKGDEAPGILNNRFHPFTRTIYLFLVLKVIKKLQYGILKCFKNNLYCVQTEKTLSI